MVSIVIACWLSLTIGWAEDSNMPGDVEVTRIGFLASDVNSHPMSSFNQSSDQLYFDVINEADDQRVRQICVEYPPQMQVPEEHERKIEMRGSIRIIELGGPPGTPRSYRGECLTLTSWRYLD